MLLWEIIARNGGDYFLLGIFQKQQSPKRFIPITLQNLFFCFGRLSTSIAIAGFYVVELIWNKFLLVC